MNLLQIFSYIGLGIVLLFVSWLWIYTSAGLVFQAYFKARLEHQTALLRLGVQHLQSETGKE